LWLRLFAAFVLAHPCSTNSPSPHDSATALA
jgi:hypothetical protein